MSDDILKKCRLCPRNCLVNRYIDVGFCGASSDIKLARADLHYYEEPSISGISGSGAVFFSGCNLRCVFCQNYHISNECFGKFISIDRLANIFLELNVDLLPMVVSIVVCMLVAYMIQFFRLTLDYHGTRKLQFEDDEYYYYVTAVPKIKVAAVDKTVTRIVPDEDDENQDLRSELEKELENDFNNFE